MDPPPENTALLTSWPSSVKCRSDFWQKEDYNIVNSCCFKTLNVRKFLKQQWKNKQYSILYCSVVIHFLELISLCIHLTLYTLYVKLNTYSNWRFVLCLMSGQNWRWGWFRETDPQRWNIRVASLAVLVFSSSPRSFPVENGILETHGTQWRINSETASRHWLYHRQQLSWVSGTCCSWLLWQWSRVLRHSVVSDSLRPHGL